MDDSNLKALADAYIQSLKVRNLSERTIGAVCCTCVRTCPYNVPVIGQEGHAVIDAAGCQGCGCCVAECPGKAINLKHFTDQQLIAKTAALFANCQTAS